MINLNNLWENREEILKRCDNDSFRGYEYERLLKAANEIDFKTIVLERFCRLVKFKVIETSIVFKDVNNFAFGRCCVQTKEGFGYITDDGSYIVEPKYDYLTRFCNGMTIAHVQTSSSPNRKYKMGYINTNGELMTEIKYDFISSFDVYNSSSIVVRLADKWGLIDRNGKELVVPKYDGHVLIHHQHE